MSRSFSLRHTAGSGERSSGEVPPQLPRVRATVLSVQVPRDSQGFLPKPCVSEMKSKGSEKGGDPPEHRASQKWASPQELTQLTRVFFSPVLAGLKPPVQKAHLHAHRGFCLQQVQQILQWLSGLRLLHGWRGTKDKDWCVLDYLDRLLTLARHALRCPPMSRKGPAAHTAGHRHVGPCPSKPGRARRLSGVLGFLPPPACCVPELLKAGLPFPFLLGQARRYLEEPDFFRLIIFFYEIKRSRIFGVDLITGSLRAVCLASVGVGGGIGSRLWKGLVLQMSGFALQAMFV